MVVDRLKNRWIRKVKVMVDWTVVVIDIDRWTGLGGSFAAGMNQFRGDSRKRYYRSDRRSLEVAGRQLHVRARRVCNLPESVALS
jgi:hypothetical protein